VSPTSKIILETVQKVGKIVDIHFFKNVAFEKKIACKKIGYDIYFQ
jgi:hypothetical protein